MNEAEREEAISKLAQRTLSFNDTGTRLGAIQDIGDLGDMASLDVLIQVLDDESAPVRAAAAEAMGRLGDSRAVEYLAALLLDSVAEVRLNALRALGNLGADEVLGELGSALHDGSPEVRAAAVEVLGALHQTEAIEILTSALADSDPRVKETAELVLAETISEETEAVTEHSPTPNQEDEAEGNWQPATPGLPGYPTDPPLGQKNRGEPGTTPSEKGISDDGKPRRHVR